MRVGDYVMWSERALATRGIATRADGKKRPDARGLVLDDNHGGGAFGSLLMVEWDDNPEFAELVHPSWVEWVGHKAT